MAQNKTQPTKQKVSAFISGIEDLQKRADCRELMKIMRNITGRRATMWGPGIVGFGKYKTGKSCLYVKRLDDIDRDVFTALIQASVDYLREKYPGAR